MNRLNWLLSSPPVPVSAMLGMAIGSCSDDSKAGMPAAGASAGGTAAAGTASGSSGTNAGASSTDPNAAAACPAKVYAALSDGCKSCACKLDPQLAPSCQKPCWDFLACSFKAKAGKCASFAAGGDAMRPEFEACTMEECGAVGWRTRGYRRRQSRSSCTDHHARCAATSRMIRLVL